MYGVAGVRGRFGVVKSALFFLFTQNYLLLGVCLCTYVQVHCSCKVLQFHGRHFLYFERRKEVRNNHNCPRQYLGGYT